MSEINETVARLEGLSVEADTNLWRCDCGWLGRPDSTWQQAYNGTGSYRAPSCPECGLYLGYKHQVLDQTPAAEKEDA